MKIKIKNNLFFDTKKKPLLIAEISGNHSQSKKKFLDLILKSHKSGADLIKIQTYEPQDLTLKSFTNGFRVKKGTWKKQYLWDLYKKAHTPFNWHDKLFKYARSLKIEIFSTPFDESSVDFLEKLNCPFYKVASFEMTDLPLIKKIAKTKKPMIISTGMASLEEIKTTFDVAKRNGANDISM